MQGWFMNIRPKYNQIIDLLLHENNIDAWRKKERKWSQSAPISLQTFMEDIRMQAAERVSCLDIDSKRL